MSRHHQGAARAARRADYDPDARAAQPARRARATGYRHDSPRHEDARSKVDAALRRAIARMGGEARAALYRRDRSEARQPHPTPAARPAPAQISSFSPPRGPAPPRSTPAPPPARSRAPQKTVVAPPQSASRAAKLLAAAARAAASRPARRAAQRARERAAKERQP